MKHWTTLQIGEFNGPLDLLLTMIKDKKMSLKDVNLTELTDQYVSYLAAQQSLDIEIASEYLTMAAQLIEMKSRYLLPQNPNLIADENPVYEDFLEQLSRYEQIRSVTEFFMQKQEEYLQTFSKPRSKTKFASKVNQLNAPANEELIDVSELDIDEFAQIFKRVMMNAELRQENCSAELLLEDFNTITTKNISPQEVAQLILQTMKTNKLKVWRLEELLPDNFYTIKNLIATFLAVLDIVRYQIATIQQADQTLLVEFTPWALENPTAMENLEVEKYDE